MTETERIKIYPASREQMERIIQAEKDDELKKAYGEMLEGCLTHPDQWDWYAMWMIAAILYLKEKISEKQTGFSEKLLSVFYLDKMVVEMVVE